MTAVNFYFDNTELHGYTDTQCTHYTTGDKEFVSSKCVRYCASLNCVFAFMGDIVYMSTFINNIISNCMALTAPIIYPNIVAIYSSSEPVVEPSTLFVFEIINDKLHVTMCESSTGFCPLILPTGSYKFPRFSDINLNPVTPEDSVIYMKEQAKRDDSIGGAIEAWSFHVNGTYNIPRPIESL